MDAVLDAAALSSPLDTTDAQQRRLQQLEQERAGIKARIEQHGAAVLKLRAMNEDAESRLQQKQAVLDVSSRRLRKTQTRIHSIQQQLERYAEYQELQIDQMERRSDLYVTVAELIAEALRPCSATVSAAEHNAVVEAKTHELLASLIPTTAPTTTAAAPTTADLPTATSLPPAQQTQDLPAVCG